MWGRGIKMCTQILHREYMSRDIAHAQWRFALVRHSQKRLEICTWSQWSTNRKWGMRDRMVTWPMTSRDLERSKSWPHYLHGWTSPKRLEINAWWEWSTNGKWCMEIRMITWLLTSRDLERSRSWPNYLQGPHCLFTMTLLLGSNEE